jgi:hypothetical protein
MYNLISGTSAEKIRKKCSVMKADVNKGNQSQP